MRITIEKKHKYLAYSFLLSLFVTLYAYGNSDYQKSYAVCALITAFLGAFITQYPTIKFTNIFSQVLLPMHLTVGVILTFLYFPNLSFLLKLGLMGFFAFSIYLLCLVNNVFLVVNERNESIPLFRAAVTWVQIIIGVIAIPYFAGVFKLPINAFYQNLIVSISCIFFVDYLMWVFKLDKDFKIPTVGERLVLISLTFLLVFSLGIGVSFIPTESFLRGIFVSSVLMFCVNYIYGHLRNSINKNTLIQQVIISILFFILMVIFTP